jgi:hypothetical protein
MLVNSAPGTSYFDTDPYSLERVLALDAGSGLGSQSWFARTTAAGLAYANGPYANLSSGRFYYFADHCPNMAETLAYAHDLLRDTERSPVPMDYAVARCFDGTRRAWDQDARAEAMAADVADGLTSQVVGRFFRAILALRSQVGIERRIGGCLPAVGAAVLNGPDSLVIGTDAQIQAYERGMSPRRRICPADFWLP